MVYGVNTICPGCGRCMCCGRQSAPYYPYPWWGTAAPRWWYGSAYPSITIPFNGSSDTVIALDSSPKITGRGTPPRCTEPYDGGVSAHHGPVAVDAAWFGEQPSPVTGDCAHPHQTKEDS